MLKINTSDGLTARIDLDDDAQARDLLRRLQDPSYQASVSAISLTQKYGAQPKCQGCGRACQAVCTECRRDGSPLRVETSVQYNLIRPVGYRRVQFEAEPVHISSETRPKGGELMTCYLDDTRITVMVHRSQPSVRIALAKTGRRSYNPDSE